MMSYRSCDLAAALNATGAEEEFLWRALVTPVRTVSNALRMLNTAWHFGKVYSQLALRHADSAPVDLRHEIATQCDAVIEALAD